jgi:outer membrane protein
MRFLKYILILLFVAGAFVSNAQQTMYSLQQCLQIAIKNNLTAQQDSITAQSARISFLQSKENLLPSVSGVSNFR